MVMTIEVIYQTMTTKWRKQGRMELEIPQLWDEYVPKHLLPRLYGFELMMAPYAIAHMKIGLKLADTGYKFRSDERLHLYLTNTLEPPRDLSGQLEFMAPALAHEAKAVDEVKKNRRFTVVIGNPPYSVVSANVNEWITSLVRESYYPRDEMKEQNPKMLRRLPGVREVAQGPQRPYTLPRRHRALPPHRRRSQRNHPPHVRDR
jgi:hypothetical protein